MVLPEKASQFYHVRGKVTKAQDVIPRGKLLIAPAYQLHEGLAKAADVIHEAYYLPTAGPSIH